MKSNNNFRGKSDSFQSEDSLRKASKLEPIKKNGKEKRLVLTKLEEEDEEEYLPKKRESVLDYFDDVDEDEVDDEDLEDTEGDDYDPEDDDNNYDDDDDYDDDDFEDEEDEEEER